jgi:ABC-type uncharacterized transport system permease subunit
MKNFFQKKFQSFLPNVLGLILGLSLCLVLTKVAGENPVHVLQVLLQSSFGSNYDLGLTLFYTSCFIFTGLSVCIAFHAGMFNIGAEGQLLMGAMSTAAVGILAGSLPTPVLWSLMFFIPLLVSAGWGAIAGALKAYRQSHEVIVTMMMNFVAAGLTSFLTLYVFKNPESQNPETANLPNLAILDTWDPMKKIFPDSAVGWPFLLAIFAALSLHFFLKDSRLGFRLKATGQNPEAAKLAGIQVARMQILGMAMAGALAGCVGFAEVWASSHKFKMGFSADYGFIGIAVALLARNHPLSILLSALLFGVLHKGASSLDLETEHITRDFSKILQSVIILSVIAVGTWDLLKQKRKGKTHGIS